MPTGKLPTQRPSSGRRASNTNECYPYHPLMAARDFCSWQTASPLQKPLIAFPSIGSGIVTSVNSLAHVCVVKSSSSRIRTVTYGVRLAQPTSAPVLKCRAVEFT